MVPTPSGSPHDLVQLVNLSEGEPLSAVLGESRTAHAPPAPCIAKCHAAYDFHVLDDATVPGNAAAAVSKELRANGAAPVEIKAYAAAPDGPGADRPGPARPAGAGPQV